MLLSTVGVAISAVAMPAYAQETSEDGTDDNTIVVTAQKREERLQDVPLAVTAVTGDSLAEANITETTALQRIAPSLTYTQGNNPSNSTFRIRGIGTQVFGQGTETSVATVIDGVVLARQAQGFTDLGDIERVEVLRGPQGTLFGKNATAGVINIVTRRPSNELEGRVSATIAEMGEYHLNGGLSGPLSDNVGFRLSGYYNNDSGYIYNHATDTNVNGYETYGFNGKLEFDLGDLNLLLGGSYYHNSADCCVQVAIQTTNANLATLQFPVIAGRNNREVNTNLGLTSFTESEIYSLEGNYDLGGATITSITAYQIFRSDNNYDVDMLNNPVPIYSGGNGNAPYYAQFQVNGGPFNLDQFSQELRISSNGDNRLNYVAGLFYSDLGLNRSFQRRIVSCPTTIAANQGLAIGAICPSPTASSGSHSARLDSSHIAAFGQIDFEVVDGLTLIGGLRIQHEKISASGAQDAAPLVVGDTPMFSGATLTSGTTTASDDAITGRAGIQYEFSRFAQAYATYTRGYKGQSLGTEFNQTFNNNPVVAPEHVNAYEVGFKGRTTDGLLQFALAAFQADYTNLQVQANRSDQATGNFLFVVTNAGQARTRGIELESTLQPSDAFSVDFNLTYIDAQFDADGLACPLADRVGTPIIAVGQTVPFNTCVRIQTVNNSNTTVTSGPTQLVRDGTLPNTPEWRIGISPRYEREFGDFLGFVDFNFQYQSSVIFSLEQDQNQIQQGYWLADATIGIRPQDRGFSASVFVRNMFDQLYYGSIGTGTSLTSQTLTPDNLTAFRPRNSFRYFGASVGYTF
ncbi:MAG: TonB-dependent receptor [Erythrobacter sp.]|nr:TonB-dependent receptor [Erythrobacter sp.]